jgi:hypothetical protein
LESISAKQDGLTFTIKQENILLGLDDALVEISNRETRNSLKIIQLYDSYIELDSKQFVGSIHVDESISTRRDAYLKLTFSVQRKEQLVEVNLYEPNGRKHQSKYNVKCRDSALFLYNSLEISDFIQEIVCEFRRPKLGRWTFEIIKTNSNDQKTEVKAKARIFFQNEQIDESSYYSNYSDRDD